MSNKQRSSSQVPDSRRGHACTSGGMAVTRMKIDSHGHRGDYCRRAIMPSRHSTGGVMLESQHGRISHVSLAWKSIKSRKAVRVTPGMLHGGICQRCINVQMRMKEGLEEAQRVLYLFLPSCSLLGPPIMAHASGKRSSSVSCRHH